MLGGHLEIKRGLQDEKHHSICKTPTTIRERAQANEQARRLIGCTRFSISNEHIRIYPYLHKIFFAEPAHPTMLELYSPPSKEGGLVVGEA